MDYFSQDGDWREQGYTDAKERADRPLPGEEGFAERFRAAQVRVLGWAGVDGARGLELS